MKILLIAPNQGNIDSVPEIRTLTALHHVQVLNGTVTTQDVYHEVRRQKFNVIHFAALGGVDGVELSNDEILSSDDVISLARLSGASLVFLNACNTSRVAAQVVSHIQYVISANDRMFDKDAWKFPLRYYEYLQNIPDQDIEVTDYARAFTEADSGDGLYSFLININEYTERPSNFDFDKLNSSISGLKKEIESQKRYVTTYVILSSIVFIFMSLILFLHLSGVL